MEYKNDIIIPYLTRMRENFGEDRTGLVIYNNFKGQVTDNVLSLLDENDISIVTLPLNTTDQLQPMDLSVNKSIKEFALMTGIQERSMSS